MARAPRTVLLTFALVLLLAVAAVLGGRAWLETSGGERWLARELARRVSAEIAGTLRVDRVDLDGLDSATATGVELAAPDGTIAARAARVELELSLLELLAPTKRVDRLRVAGLVLELVDEREAGFAIARALEPAGTEAPAPTEPASEGGVVIRDVRVELDRFAYRGAPGAAPSFEGVDGVAEGSVEVRADSIVVDADVSFTAIAPVTGPAEARLAASLDGGRIEVSRLDATLPGGIEVRARTKDASGEAAAAGGAPPAEAAPNPSARATAAGATQRDGDGGADVGALGDLDVGVTIPADGLVPYGGPVLRGTLDAHGAVAQRGGAIAFDVTVRPPGPGQILAAGSLDRDSGRFSLLLDARGVDPARMLEGLPNGRVWAALSASGTIDEPVALAGKLWLARSRLRGARFGPGEARVRLRAGRLFARDVVLALPGATVSGGIAIGGAVPPAADLRASVASLERLAPVLRALGGDVPQLEGGLAARVRVDGAGSYRTLALEVRSEHVRIAEHAVRALALDARLAGKAATLRLRAEVAQRRIAIAARAERAGRRAVRLEELAVNWGNVTWRLGRDARIGWAAGQATVEDLVLEGTGRLAVDLALPLGGSGSAAPARLDVRVDALPFAPFRPFLPAAVPPGRVTGSIALRGSLARPEIATHLTIATSPEAGEPFELSVDVTATPRVVEAAATARLSGEDVMTFSGALRASGRAPLWKRDALLGARVDAAVEIAGLELDALSRSGALPADTTGELAGTLAAKGLVRTVDVTGELRVSALAVDDPELGRLPPVYAELRLDARRGLVTAEVSVALDGAPPVRGRLRVPRSIVALVGERGQVPFEATAEVRSGALHLPRLSTTASAIAVVAKATGTFDAPRADLRAEAEGLVIRGEHLGAARLEAALAPELTTAALALLPAQGGSLDASVTVRDEGPWRIDLVADEARLSILEALPKLAAVDRAVIDGSLRVHGGPEPSATGRLAISAARVRLPGFTTVRDVALRLSATGRTVELEQAVASIQEGRVEARGRVALRSEEATAELRVETKRFPIPVGPRPVGALTTKIDAQLALRGEQVSGDVRIAPGEFRLPDGLPGELHPISLPSDVVVHRPGEDEAQDGGPSRIAAFLQNLRARVGIRAPGDLWIRSEAANLDVSGDLVARWDGDRLAFTGAVVVPRGTVTVVRRRFAVDRVELAFRGDPEVDPSLEGRLTHAQANVDVAIALGGTLRDPELELSSDPPMDASEIAALIAVGGGGRAPETGVSGAVLTGALNFVAGQVGEALAANLPIDVLAFELGPSGEARRFEAGAYLTPRLFVSFVRNLLAEPDENTHEVRAEYEIRQRLTLETRYGDRQSGGLDLLYERRFPSPSQQRARAAAAARRVAPEETALAPTAD